MRTIEPILATGAAAPLPGPRPRLEYLDSFRGVACLMVFFYHTAVNLSLFGVPFYGYHGVHLFFVLSGYLLAGKFIPALLGAEPLRGVRAYLWRRVLRIYPPYLICLGVFVGLRVASGTNVPVWRNVLLRGGLLFNYVDRYDYFAINGGFWSLAVEMQFYLFLPFAVWLILRTLPAGTHRAWMFPVLFLTIGILSRSFEAAFINHSHPEAIARIRFKWASSHLDLFGVGILLRVAEARALQRTFRLGWIGGTIGWALGISVLALVAIWTKAAGHWQDSDDLLFTALGPTLACLGFALLLGSTGASPLRESRVFRWAGLVWLGQISYSLYLYHPGIFYVFNRVFKPDLWGISWGPMTLLIGICCLPLALGVAWLAYWLFERPCFRPVTAAASLPHAVQMPQ